MKQSYYLSLALLMIGSEAMAATVSEEEARVRAIAFFESQDAATRNATALTCAYTDEGAEGTRYYAFNRAGGGFVLIGGQDKAREVLGYSEHGAFVADSLPPTFREFLASLCSQLDAASDEIVDASEAEATRSARTSINPMITTEWNQYAPYYNAIPKVYDSNGQLAPALTGCGATALAQLMYFYKYPTQGTGSNAYSLTYTYHKKDYKVNFSANFAHTTYDYAHMRTTYAGVSYTDTEATAVATLMYHAGVAAGMSYGADGSSSSVYNCSKALIDHFGYDASMRYVMRSYFNDADWEALIYNTLATGYPILYTGESNGGYGHAFLCDGYQAENDLYHFNWGWGGYCDGFYPITSTVTLSNGTQLQPLKPNGDDVDYQFILSQTAVLGIKPDAGGTLTPALCTEGYSLEPASVEQGYKKVISLNKVTGLDHSGYFFNYALDSMVYYTGVKLVSTTDDNEVYYSSLQFKMTLPAYQGLGPLYYFVPANAPAGKYYVYPICSDSPTGTIYNVLYPTTFSAPVLEITQSSGIEEIVSEAAQKGKRLVYDLFGRLINLTSVSDDDIYIEDYATPLMLIQE